MQRQHDDDKHLLMEASLDGVLAGFPLPGWSKKHASCISHYLFFLFLHSPLDVIDLDNDAVDIAKCLGRLSHWRKEAVYLLLLNTRWTPPVFEEGLSIFSSCCCVATMNWRICGHQQIMCLIEVNYLFLLLGWLTLSFWLLSFDNWKIARKTLTIAGIPPYSSSRTASPFNLHKSTYLDLLKVLCDCRHQVDAALQGNALQGNLLTSEIPSPIMLGLIYCLLQTAGWGYSSPLLSMTQMRRAWAHQVI